MTPKAIAAQLSVNLATLVALFRDVTPAQARWKPAPEKWSLLEVLCHLHDEERDDFRARIRLLFEDPQKPWPGIDPGRWAVERRYNESCLEEKLEAHQRERAGSVAWLETLQDADWDVAAHHPIAGRLSAGDLLASWVFHDFLHLRQLATIQMARLNEEVKPFSTRYASP